MVRVQTRMLDFAGLSRLTAAFHSHMGAIPPGPLRSFSNPISCLYRHPESMAGKEHAVVDVMTKSVMSVELNTNAKDCAKAMAKRGVSCAVVTQNGSAVGIVTERDLVSKVLAESIDARSVLVRDIMSTPLITVSPDAALTSAAELMARYRIRRLVVVDTMGGLVGIVTTGDIARTLAEKHGYREATFNAMARYAEGEFEGGPYQ